MYAVVGQWDNSGVLARPRYSAFGGPDIGPYMENFRELPFRVSEYGRLCMIGVGSDALRHLAFVFSDMKTDIELHIGARIFTFEERGGVHFCDFKKQFIRTGVKAFFKMPARVLGEMRNATKVLPMPLVRIIAEYHMDLTGMMFAVCRWVPKRIPSSKGDVLDLPTEVVKDPHFLPQGHKEMDLNFNQNIITDLEWTPGTSWTMYMGHMPVFESPRDDLSEWILGEFSGGSGRMHVGHFVPGDRIREWRIKYEDSWKSRPLTNPKSIPNSVDIFPFERKEDVHKMLSMTGNPQTKITRMFPTPIQIDISRLRTQELTEYLVFVETQNGCRLFDGQFPKVFGYNNVLLVDEEDQMAVLRWPERS